MRNCKRNPECLFDGCKMFEGGQMELKITKVNNGYTLEGTFGNDEEPSVDVIEEDEVDELVSGEGLLWSVMDYFNFGGSKHDKERIRVIRETNE